MAISNFAPMPAQDPMTEPEYPDRLPEEVSAALGRMLITRVWMDWFTAVNTRLDASPATAATPVSLTGQGASIPTTAIPIASIAQGVYRVSWYARVTTPATTSSSLIVAITTTDTSATVTQSGAAMISNSTALPASGSFLCYCDRSSLISYSTTYASVGGTSMVYKLLLVAEAVSQA